MLADGIFNTQGHRGCRGLMPENTIEGMLKALDLGVVTVEMDVVISKDNQVVLSHEPFFNHEITTLPNGIFIAEKEEHLYNIYNMLYKDIKTYDVGLKAHPVFINQQKIRSFKPLLSEVFDTVKNYMASANRPYPYFNIEIKCLPEIDEIFHPLPSIFIDLVMKVIIDKEMQNQVQIQSFDCRCLQYLHLQYPTIPIGLLIEKYNKSSLAKQIKNLGFLPAVYSPEQSLITPELISECHLQKIKIIPWTINEISTINKFRGMGVDGIISDYPNLFF